MTDPLVGRTYTAEPFEVSAVKIREFARATRATHPAHVDRDAAAELGASDLVAPLTFVVSPAQAAEFLFLDDPEAGIDFSRIVHGREAFTYVRPVVAGDVLHATYTVESVVARGGMKMITGRTAITDADGEPVASALSTMIERGEA